MSKEQQTIQKIDRYGFFYKMGVLAGQTLLSVQKFDSFEKMILEAERIDNTHKSDMRYCTFCFQAFKDDTYNFGTSCFFQCHTSVNGISGRTGDIKRAIIKSYEIKFGEAEDNEQGEVYTKAKKKIKFLEEILEKIYYYSEEKQS